MSTMSQKPLVSAPTSSAQGENGRPPKPPETVKLLREIEGLIQQNQPRKALELLSRSKLQSPWLVNAQGVCQLRLGNAQGALDAFRGLVISDGFFRADAPPVFKTNFSAASLLSGEMHSGLNVLRGMIAKQHPAVGRLKVAIRQWKQSLTFAQRINWFLGGEPNRPFTADFPLGDLE